METSPEFELVQYTDPYCTWCWGTEPILRKVEEVFGGNDVEPDFPTADKESILEFVRRSANTAPREVVEVFDLDETEADRYLDSLVADGAIRRRRVGNGFFYSAM